MFSSFLLTTRGWPPTVEQRPGYRVFTAKYSKRRTAHGHRILFREIDGGIEIIRLMHTAMYWPDQTVDG